MLFYRWLMIVHVRPASILLGILIIGFSPNVYASKLPTTFDGYVTNIASAHEFDVGARHVVWDAKTQHEVTYVNHDPGGFLSTSIGPIDTDLHVGSHVHVEGTVDKRTGGFTATLIHSFPESVDSNKRKLEGAGLIEETPQLHQDGQSWSGTVWIDGYPLQLTPQTKLASEDGSPFSPDHIGTNVWVEYQATRRPDNSLSATSLTLSPLKIEDKEKKFREKSEPEIEKPDYEHHVPGNLKWHWNWALEIVPDENIQNYVSGVGSRLVPQYQKDLPSADPSKIDFRFYVVHRPAKWKEALWTQAMSDATASPGGVVIVPDNVLAALDNEAQLAALLSNCIAVTLERQAYTHRTRMHVQRDLNWIGLATIGGDLGAPLLIGNSIAYNNLMLQINEQAGRIGLRYMLQNGYDLREAPFAWTIAANKRAENPDEPNIPAPQLAQSLMSDLLLGYKTTDYGALTTNREPYQQMLAQLHAAFPDLPKPKNHS
ncbi:hypothetical protein HNQ77_002584 [Silvibacterium bohemicum]|uniref:DUF5666 domain-containing protein n=1 Tax=Silvibacterium bohemicum TaxID=1577686 RepID=A0A841K1V0_9BACT|nr:DUF5666 domain-containing protein [Silvibacterium bohemicum]MBB6144628.1 hypothetical protein [Silvibacterium bohemicum]